LLGFRQSRLWSSEIVVGSKRGRRCREDTPSRRHPPELRLSFTE
jgi:hypothetical protein